MRGIFTYSVLLVMLSMFVAGCAFKQQPSKGVVYYKPGKVYLIPDRYYASGSYYRVGELPMGWSRMKTPARTISFYHEGYQSSISTDAYCGKSISNRSLVSLTGDIISGLEDPKIEEEHAFMLDERGALRQRVSGTVDGVPTIVDIVVLRKNGCVFDLYAVSPPTESSRVQHDFESFFNAFHYE